MEIFKLFGSIFVDNSEANSSIQKTGDEAEKSGGMLSKLGGFAKGAGAAVAAISTGALAAGAALGNIAMKSSEAASRVNDMAQKLGLSNEAFQEWDYILGLNGASIDSFGVGMKTLQTKMVDLGQGGKAATELFDTLGMSFDEVSQMSPEQAMEAVIKKLQAMPEGAKKADLALQAFGKQGMELLPVLNMTAEETEGLKNTAHELGMVMSDEAIKAGDDFGDMLDTAKGMISGMANTMGAELLPAMTSGLEAFVGFVSGAEGAEDKLQEAFDGIVGAITEKMPEFIEKGATIVLSLVKGLSSALPSLVKGVMEIIPTIVETVIKMLPDILKAGIEVLTALIMGIADALPDLIPVAVDALLTLIETLIDNVDMLIDAAIAIILALAEGLINALPRLIEKVPVIISKLVEAITSNGPKLVEMGITLIIQLAVGLIKAIPELIKAIPQIIAALAGGLGDSISQFWDIGKNIVEGLWEGISGMGKWIADKVSGFFGGIISGVKGLFGIASPSKVFAEIGKFTGEGFVDGIEAMSGKVSNAVDDVFGGLGGDITANVIPIVGDTPALSVSQPRTIENVVMESLNAGFMMISDTILAALPEVLQFYLDGDQFAESAFKSNDTAAMRRNRMYAPTREQIEAIARSVMPAGGLA